ncbi:hypothetical protein V6N13_051239 [Hibiscus sabdariffa]
MIKPPNLNLCCPRPFSYRASVPLPWRASFPLVPRFASPRIVAWLLALDISARPHCWPLLCVPKIVAFLSTSFASLAQPSCWLLTCGSRLGSPWHVEGQKFQYGAWLRAPLPKRSISRPRGRISLVEDDMDIPVPADLASDGPPTYDEPAEAHATVSNPVAPAVAASVVKAPSTPVAETDADNLCSPLAPFEAADLVEDAVVAPLDPENSETAADRLAPEDAPYDPMVHTETSDMLEEALEISRDCVLLADLTGVIQANREDLVNEAIPEAADSIIRDVATSILGASTSPASTVVSSQPSPRPIASPPKPGHSRSAPASSRRAAMPMVHEHHEFDAWCAAQSRTPPVVTQN